MTPYFAYGSNLNLDQMPRRCPGHRVATTAVLRGWRLCWPRPWSHDNIGGVLSIERAVGEDVYGAVYELTPDNVAALDRYEGIATGEYRRTDIDVLEWKPGDSTGASDDAQRRVLPCMTYIANPADQPHYPPNCAYHDIVLAGARAHRLPDSYIDQLLAVPTRD